MPFITEEIWQLMEERKEGESIMVQPAPVAEKYNKNILEQFETLKEAVTSIRNIRKEKNISHKERLHIYVKDNMGKYPELFTTVLQKLGHTESVEFTSEKIEKAISFRVKAIEFYIPLEDKVDYHQEIKALTEELEYTRGFLKSVLIKLKNENFVKNAPDAVIEKERKKKEDAENKIRLLQERIEGMRKRD
jgi:valyl-tRNA synthetase